MRLSREIYQIISISSRQRFYTTWQRYAVLFWRTAAARAGSGVDLSDYQAVAKYYNLKD
ncbi:hypothetical protein [Chitinophaga sp. RAB17]|uniref:hypothetical protein n=1 Tax=Chitinophaga sp. RAB17 TaxID=3233049 RepID=UPI003F8FC22F